MYKLSVVLVGFQPRKWNQESIYQDFVWPGNVYIPL